MKVFSSLFKIILTFYQIHEVINSFDYPVPREFEIIISSLGAPVGSLYYSLDCKISPYFNMPIIYVKLIWLCLSPLGYFIILFFFQCLFFKLYKFKLKVNYFISSLLFLFIYLTPGILQFCILVATCRSIGSTQKFISADVSL